MASSSQTTVASPRRRIVIAICLRHYLPGYKSGGPVRTISNLVEHLGDEFDFYIVTSDRDIHDTKPYAGVTLDAWQTVGKARVYYGSPTVQTLTGIAQVLNGINADVIYLNSFFDARFTILPLLARRLGLLRQRRMIVAPRGEFADSALRIRAWKKLPYRVLARLTGLYSGVTWHASSEFERADIQQRMGTRAGGATLTATNLPKHESKKKNNAWLPRRPGEPLRVIFLARIAPMKNLHHALHILASANVPCIFNVYGMVDDEGYCRRCLNDFGHMPQHVAATYHGPLSPEEVGATLAGHDVLLLPTLGENYGHVIAESLTQGTPVLISDRTPWRDLHARGVGWDLPLDESGEAFVAALKSLAAMGPHESAVMRRRVADYAAEKIDTAQAIEANRRLLAAACHRCADGI